MSRVDFMILGAQKCGTTSLYRILAAHPSINGSHPKEPDFFSHYDDWRDRLEEYHRCFDFAPDTLAFEASVGYTFSPMRRLCLWNDLWDYNPHLKFFYIVRDPLERILSAYMHNFERGYTDLPLDRAVIRDRLYVDASRYVTQISPFIERFGPDQVMVIDFDDFVQHRDLILREISSFLDVDHDGFRGFDEVHANPGLQTLRRHHRFDHPGPIHRLIRRCCPPLWRRLADNSRRRFQVRPTFSPKTRHALIQLLHCEIDALQPMIGKDLSHWLAGHSGSPELQA